MNGLNNKLILLGYSYKMKFRNLLSNRDISALIFILVATLAAYIPSYISTYGFSDDYSTYFAANLSHTNFIKWDVMSGRPAYAVLRYIAGKFIETTSDFTFSGCCP